jgi:hypothetical protein
MQLYSALVLPLRKEIVALRWDSVFMTVSQTVLELETWVIVPDDLKL